MSTNPEQDRPEEPSIVCPRCGERSFNPNDIRHRYCGQCHRWHDERQADPLPRADHLAWCKRRALAYLPADPRQAFASMARDLGKHPETAGHAGCEIGLMLLIAGHLDHPAEMREFIEGFR